jgi:hypothetical protein
VSLNERSRAVALKALAADVAARLKLGESPEAIRADLLKEGYKPEVIEPIIAAGAAARRVGRTRTAVAFGLSAVLMIGLPLAGAFGGAWIAIETALAKELPPVQDGDAPKPADAELRPVVDRLSDFPVAALVGMAVGGGIGLAVAFPIVKALSSWSMDGALADDEDGN